MSRNNHYWKAFEGIFLLKLFHCTIPLKILKNSFFFCHGDLLTLSFASIEHIRKATLLLEKMVMLQRIFWNTILLHYKYFRITLFIAKTELALPYFLFLLNHSNRRQRQSIAVREWYTTKQNSVTVECFECPTCVFTATLVGLFTGKCLFTSFEYMTVL